MRAPRSQHPGVSRPLGVTAPYPEAEEVTAMAGSESVTVLNPAGYPPKVTGKQLAPRLDSLDGKTVYLVDCRFDQLRGDHSQATRSRYDHQPHADVHMDDVGHGFLAALCSSQRHGRKRLVAAGSSPWDTLLPGWFGWRSTALAAPFLVFRTSRSVHPDLTRFWYYLRGIAGLLTQTSLWLYLYCMVRCGYRLPQLHGVGTSHVRSRPAFDCSGLFRNQYDTDCYSDSGEGL